MRFTAELEKIGGQAQWTIVRMPFDVGEVFGSRGIVKVRVRINGVEFQSSLFPRKGEPHFMMISKVMQKSARLSNEAGQVVELELAPDAHRKIEVPPALKKVFARNRRAAAFFKKIPDSWKRGRIDRVLQAKTAAGRERAALRVAQYLNELEDGLAKLPAPLNSALAKSPAAKQQFAKLPPSLRKMYIGWVVDATTDETRKRRAQRIVQRLLSADRDGNKPMF